MYHLTDYYLNESGITIYYKRCMLKYMYSFKSYKMLILRQIHELFLFRFFFILLHLPFHEHVERRKHWEDTEGNVISLDSDIV